MTYQQVLRDISKSKIAPVYLITGNEDYLLEDIEEQLKEKTITKGVESFNFLRYDEGKPDLYEILANLENLPMMSKYRMIVLEEETDFLNTTDEEFLKKFEKYLKSPSTTSVLVIKAQKPDKRKKLYKLLKKHATMIELKKLSLPELKNFIKDKLPSSVTITGDALTAFIERSHYLDNESIDTLSLLTQLDQLTDYLGGSGQIDKAIVEEVIDEGVDDNVFRLIDLIVNGRLEKVPMILDYFYQHGESPIGLFSLILYQLRNITKVKLLLDKGYIQPDIASATHLSNFVLRKILPIARRFQTERLLELIGEVADLDFKMKTGQVGMEFALEYLILKLSKTST